MNDEGIPELIEVWRIARAIGWATGKTRLFFYDAGLAQRFGGHHETMVLRADFQASMPTVYRIFAEAWKSGKLTSRRGRWSREPKRSEDNQDRERTTPKP